MRGGYFLHHHPRSGISWGSDCVGEVSSIQGVTKIVGDQCFLTNSPEIAKCLPKRCSGEHQQVKQTEGQAKNAARDPDGLCNAICEGLLRQAREDTRSAKMICRLAPRSILMEMCDDVEEMY